MQFSATEDVRIFYFGRNAAGLRKITVCLTLWGDGCVSRGLAITSPRDQFEQELGQIKARGRARKARSHAQRLLYSPDEVFPNFRVGPPIKRAEAVEMVQECMGSYPFSGLIAVGGLSYKSVFNPILSSYEQERRAWARGLMQEMRLVQRG